MSADNAAAALWNKSSLLAQITIGYNIVEGLVSVWFGISDETLSLFGFGVDSFVEVISGIAVWHMIRRIRVSGDGGRDRFEQRSLRITGGAFYLLTVGLVVSAMVNLYQRHAPVTTAWGVAVALVSMSFMWLLIRQKTTLGKQLNSPAILADAACSRACLYLSAVLLAASLGFELTGLGSLDSIGSLLIAWFAWREGKEAFQKAEGLSCSCTCSCGSR